MKDEKFLNRFGTFFVEFHEKPSKSLYYALFVTRRAVIALMILFVHHPALQLTVSGVFSLGVKFI